MVNKLSSLSKENGFTMNELPDGSVQFVKGKSELTFDAMEVAQIERGLIDTEQVRQAIMISLEFHKVGERSRRFLPDPYAEYGINLAVSEN